MLLDKEDMQQRAVSANCFDILKRTLDQLPTLAQLANHTHTANDQDDELRQVSFFFCLTSFDVSSCRAISNRASSALSLL